MRAEITSSLILILLPFTSNVKLVKVTVPDIVQSGSQVILTCAYSVSPGEYIDSIKWYLNNSECYRIVPGLTQDRVLTFPPGGECISLPQSGILKPGVHRLVINNASQSCSGQYICQVTESRPPFKTEQAAGVMRVLGTNSKSLESRPPFKTEQAAGVMRVLERPALPPILSGMESEYQQGSILNVSCKSYPGLPAPLLSWSINGQKVPAFSSESSMINDSSLSFTESRLIIKFNTAETPTRITVRCTASIGQIYEEHVVARAVFIKPPEKDTKPVPVLGEPLMSGNIGKPRCWSSLLRLLLLWLLLLISQQQLLSR